MEVSKEAERRYSHTSYIKHKEKHKLRCHLYYLKHREYLIKKAGEHAQANPDKYKVYKKRSREKNKDKYKEYVLKNIERLTEYRANYYQINKEKIKKKVHDWEEKNPERVRFNARNHAHRRREKIYNQTRKRRALLRVSGKFTNQEWEEIRKAFNYICVICKRKEPEIKLTIDHIIPIMKGGTHTKNNIQPLCSTCNKRKGAKIYVN